MFERVLNVRNDLGLLAEEHEPATGRQLGNFPQAFINTAHNLSREEEGPAERRAESQHTQQDRSRDWRRASNMRWKELQEGGPRLAAGDKAMSFGY